MNTFRYSKPCTFPESFAMPVIGRQEIALIIGFKLSVLALVLGLLGFAGLMGFNSYADAKKPYANATTKQLEDAEDHNDRIERQIEIARTAINHSNYRATNMMLLTHLFSIPYPEKDVYSLDSFNLSFQMRERPSSAENKVGEKDLGYTMEFYWKAIRPTYKEFLEQLSTWVSQNLRPDIASKQMVPWKIECKGKQEIDPNSTTSGKDLYTIRIVAVMIPPSVLSKDGRMYALLPGKKASDRKLALRDYYLSVKTPPTYFAKSGGAQ